MDFVTMDNIKKIVKSDPEKYSIGTIKVTGSICDWEIIKKYPSKRGYGYLAWDLFKLIDSDLRNKCVQLIKNVGKVNSIKEMTNPELKLIQNVDMYCFNYLVYYVQKTGESDKGDIHIKLEE